jgi:hypothetical protein
MCHNHDLIDVRTTGEPFYRPDKYRLLCKQRRQLIKPHPAACPSRDDNR